MPLQNNPQSPIELYFWHTTNGIKISIMLEELGVPYNIHGIDINKGGFSDLFYIVYSQSHNIA